MAISKITLNGVIQMDVTDTTAEAADVANTKYFYTNAGIKTQGTASGGGVNCPIFTFDYSGNTPTATCNMTYAEVTDYLNTVDNSTCAIIAISGSDYIAGANYTMTNNSTHYFTFVTGGEAYDITYASNGTITAPSDTWMVESLTATSNGTYTPTGGKAFFDSVSVNVSGGGGVSGVARGEVTIAADVAASADTKITDTTEIGFTPTKFLFWANFSPTANNAIYGSVYEGIGTKGFKAYAYYDGQGGTLYASSSPSTWTTRSTGCLYFYSGNVYIRTTTTAILKAGTYSWVAVQ